MSNTITCDIFCTVVDNFGDIGVCWRLARQLENEQGVAVRLWVDDLKSLQRLCPQVDPVLPKQYQRKVEVRLWTADAFHTLPLPPLRPQRLTLHSQTTQVAESMLPETLPSSLEGERGVADLVIEAFACELPHCYIEAMAAQETKPVWVNLEYLSAEDWVEGCHKLPSPHPRLPLVKYFFFPGFTPQTGGLLLERDLIARRDAFHRDPQAIAAFWQGLSVPQQQADELRVSLFSYENPALPEFLRAWEEGAHYLTCLVPEGRALPQVAAFFGAQHANSTGSGQGKAGDVWQRGKLRVQVLPFVEQERYDELLWACDLNFVRGEDSFVRAQWAGKPFIWQIYPQRDGVHIQKLRAFIVRYCAGLPPDAAQALQGLWEAWNGENGLPTVWNDFAVRQSILLQHAQVWAQELSGNSLALNLLDFFREIGRMRPFRIEAGET
ncbi:MAG TPA: elongation factor P maturation arginine rhamnosyltransferase EarP [Gallionellaceae bacterium]|nr:elongation factor P maturation arginine rhamnosyltransferase EarP [Gallionellaceae bacterium]